MTDDDEYSMVFTETDELYDEIGQLKKENAELKLKLCLMRKWIYGNFDLEDKIEQLKFIDEFGRELAE